MKLSRFLPALVITAISSGALHADIVTLKDGKKLEGTILEQNDAGVKIKYKVTPKIWDEKIVPMADIAPGGIMKEKPEEVEIKELLTLTPTADLMTAEAYEQVIQDRLRPFVNRYPGSPQSTQVQKMIDELQAEKERVITGEIKMDGKWLASADARAEKYNIDAFRIRQAMNDAAKAGDFSAAMKQFESFTAPGATHFLSIHYPKAVEEVIAHLTDYESKLSQMARDQPTLQKNRDDNLKRLTEPDLSRTKSAIEKEKIAAEEKYDSEKRDAKWATPYKYNIKQIKEQQKLASTESTKHKKTDIAAISAINDQIHIAIGHYYNNKLQEGYAALNAAQRLITPTVPMQYAQEIQKYGQAFVAKNYENQAKAAAQSASSTGAPGAPGTPGVAPAGGTDDAVARALQMASGGTPPGAAPGAVNPAAPGTYPQPTPGVAPQAVPGAYPQAAPGTVPGAAVPGAYPQAVPGAVPGAAVPGAYPQAVPGAVPGAAVPGAVPGAMPATDYSAIINPPVEEGGMDLNTILMIAGGVVVVVLVLAVALGGKKKK